MISVSKTSEELIDTEPLTVYRNRRGKIVQIPPEWVNNFTTKATIRQRSSKLIRKVKRAMTKNVEDYKNRNIPNQNEF